MEWTLHRPATPAALRNYFTLVVLPHVKRYWAYYAYPLAAVVAFHHAFLFGINVTESLPDKVFLTHKGNHQLSRGDYVTFTWQGGDTPYPAGIMFTKIVIGLPGDLVTRQGQEFFVNGRSVGVAKTVSSRGIPLDPGPTGVIPPGHYYVMTHHKDSLDSRYAVTGWIRDDAVIGKTYGLF